jgi:hypothetical protein
MKKTILFLLASVGLFMLPPSQLLAQAKVTSTHSETDFTGGETYACDGTAIMLSGTQTVDLHSVTTKNRFSLNQHSRVDITGTDASGNTYIGRSTSTIMEQGPVVNGTYSIVLITSFRFIGQGATPDFNARLSSKVTVNANGEMTVQRSELSNSCD